MDLQLLLARRHGPTIAETNRAWLGEEGYVEKETSPAGRFSFCDLQD
jgi:hypothetical protein